MYSVVVSEAGQNHSHGLFDFLTKLLGVFMGRLVFLRSYSVTNHPTAHRVLVPHGAVCSFRSAGTAHFHFAWATPGGCLSRGAPLGLEYSGWLHLHGRCLPAGLAEQAGACLGASLLLHDPPSWAAGSLDVVAREKGSGSWRAPKA